MMESIELSNFLISRNRTTNKRKRCEVHCHDKHELYYMQEGSTTYFIDDEIFNVEKGDFVFVPKGILHRTDSGDCKNNARILINFPDSVFQGECRELYPKLCSHPVISVTKEHTEDLEELLEKIEREYKGQEPYRGILIQSCLLELFALLCRHRYERKPQLQPSDQIIYEITSYIGENFSQDISLGEISRRFSISESHLSRKFKAVTGIGINRYITYVRISNAEKLLKGGGVSVAEAARCCGYNDSNYFSMVFQRIQGVTPFQLIRHRKEEENA